MTEPSYFLTFSTVDGSHFAFAGRSGADVTKFSNAVSYGNPVVNFWIPVTGLGSQGGYDLNIGQGKVSFYSVSLEATPTAPVPLENIVGATPGRTGLPAGQAGMTPGMTGNTPGQ